MLIVDAQIHLWAKGTPSAHHRQEPYSAEQAIAGMDAAGVDRALIHEYPFRSLHPHLHRCFDAFGPERMFWGTDITRMQCSWRQCVTLFIEELPWLKGRDLELVMGESVCNWLGWPLPPRAKG
jgi:hypothetical protein